MRPASRRTHNHDTGKYNRPIGALGGSKNGFHIEGIVYTGNHTISTKVKREFHKRKEDRDEQAALDFRELLDELGR